MPQQYSGGDPTVRLEYASDTDALHSPAGSSIVGAATASGSHRMMNGNVSSSSIVSRQGFQVVTGTTVETPNM